DAQDAGGEVLLERRLAHVLAPSALEERLAARVEVEGAFARIEERVHAKIGVPRRDRRAPADRVAEMVGDGVLHPQRHEVEALHRAAMRVRLDLERALRREQLAPAHLARALVHLVLVPVRKARDAPQDAARDARAQVRRVDEVEGTGEGDARIGRLGVRGAERGELLGERGREAARARREELLAGARFLAQYSGPFAVHAGNPAMPALQKGFKTTRITIATSSTVGISFTQR